jgi:hypothetical protein
MLLAQTEHGPALANACANMVIDLAARSATPQLWHRIHLRFRCAVSPYRVAIEAMREPTEAMTLAAADIMISPRVVWQEMIDAALAEPIKKTP